MRVFRCNKCGYGLSTDLDDNFECSRCHSRQHHEAALVTARETLRLFWQTRFTVFPVNWNHQRTWAERLMVKIAKMMVRIQQGRFVDGDRSA